MVAPINPSHSRERSYTREESFLHYVAREGRWWLRWGMIICIAAIVVLMVSPGFFFLAVIPAVLLLTLYIMLVLTNEVERRSDTEAHRVLVDYETAPTEVDVMEDHAEDDQLPAMQTEIVKRETRLALAIVGGVLLAALITAIVFLPGQVAAIGAFVFFAYLLFIAAPLWLGWFNDDIDIEQRRQRNLPDPKQARTKETVDAAVDA